MRVQSKTPFKRVIVILGGFASVATLATALAFAHPLVVQTSSPRPATAISALPVRPATLALTRLVSTGGTDAGDCSSTACATIAYAISQATAGDTISVAAGTYTQANIMVDKNLTISGAGAASTTVQVKAAPGVGTQGRIFNVGSINSASVVTISGLTMRNGYLVGTPPSVPAVGAGILNNANLTVLNSAIRDNRVDTYGFGTAIHSTGTLILTNSEITGSKGNNDGGAINLNFGSNATITNCTFSGNSTLAGGGAISIDTNGTITIRNTTITNNTAAGGGGGIQVYTVHTATVNIGNTIIAGNSNASSPDVNGPFVSAGYNLIGITNGGSGFGAATDQLGTSGSPLNAKLAPLTFNGGPTQTHALRPGSPAIDSGNAFGSATDQRGLARTVDVPSVPNAPGSDSTDIGAYEAVNPTAANGAISGRVTSEVGLPLSGAVVLLSGAQNRKAITDANGNYRFDEVNPGGFYTVTPARANYIFRPFNRSFSQIGNQNEVVFAGEYQGDNSNPLDTAEYFVRQQYLDVLGREPDESGFNYWSNQILACGDDAACTGAQRVAVAAAFFIEPEAQQRGSYIYDAYAGALGRRPGYSEFGRDRDQLANAATLEAGKTLFAQNFVQRPEFIARYQDAVTAEAFVEALIQSAQTAGTDLTGERANLVKTYGLAADLVASRAAVVRALADNASFKQSQYNSAFVLTEYFSYLHRTAESEGFTFWVNVLNAGDSVNYRGMVCSFLTSTEYQQRFSAIVSHSNGECAQR